MYDIEVFFDGGCPLCTREISLLRRLDRNEKIRFTDIAAKDFRAEDYGATQASFMEKLRGRLPDGRFIEGVEVFRLLYTAVGLGPLVRVTRFPGISHALHLAYEKFAKNRLKWTGRCTEESCAVDAHRHEKA